MPTLALSLFYYTVASPHRPGETFQSSGLFSSREWFEQCLRVWSRNGYTYSQSPEDARRNATPATQTYATCKTSFLTDTSPAYVEALVGREGSKDGACHAMTPTAAEKWAEAYRMTVSDLCATGARELAECV